MPSKRQNLTLSDAEKLRLARIAPAFDIEISEVADGRYRLHSCNEHAPLDVTLSSEVVHIRLLAEICSHAVHWVHFHFDKSCKDSLLELSNARIARIAELYALHRDAIPGNALAKTGVGSRSPNV
jgi:hypothetical protein